MVGNFDGNAVKSGVQGDSPSELAKTGALRKSIPWFEPFGWDSRFLVANLLGEAEPKAP
jgi:hypothetical protein